MSICTIDGCGRAVVGRGLCRKHYLQEWRADRVTERPKQERARHVCPPEHAHDLDTCWAEHACRCDRCRHLRKMERQRRRNRMRAYGRGDQISRARVPAAPVRDHLLELGAAGFGLERVADAAQVPRTAVLDVVYGRRGSRATPTSSDVRTRMVLATHAERLLAVTAENIDAAIVSSTGTTRRLQALVAIGWTQSELADRLGVYVGNLSPIVLGKRDRVTASTCAAVRDLFVELWEHPQAGARADQARRIAARRGWVGPLAWDDIDGDPSPAEVGQRTQLTTDELIDEIEWLHAAGESPEQIAKTLSTNMRALEKRLGRAGRGDLAALFWKRVAA